MSLPDLVIDPTGARTRHTLETAAEELAEFFRRRGDQPSFERTNSLRTKLSESSLNLVVLGQFKRGKSTLINALVGAELLPTAVVPSTSIVTVIRYGTEPRATVRFTNGVETGTDISRLGEYITETGNPSNKKQVAQVEVFFPAQFLRANVSLVDTPGVGSVFTGNTGTTHDYLPQADAAIFLLSADQPIGEAEVEFLKQARRYAARFFFVLNKIDFLSATELRESIDFNSVIISESIQGAAPIIPVSARNALLAKLDSDQSLLGRSRIEALECEVVNFLERERESTIYASAASKLQRLAREARGSVELELSALRMPLTTLAEVTDAFARKSEEIVRQRSDNDYLLSGEMSSLLSNVESDLMSFVQDSVLCARQKIQSAFDRHHKLPKRKLVDVMTTESRLIISEVFAPWRELEDKIVRDSFGRTTSRFVDRARGIINEVKELAAGLFCVDICPEIELEPLTAESRHRYYTENPFSLQLSALPLLLPSFVTKPYIREKFTRGIREEMDRNAGRLRSDFQERIEKSASRFRAAFDKNIQETLARIESVLARAAEERRRCDSAIDSLEPVLTAEIALLDRILSLTDGRAKPVNPLSRRKGPKPDAGTCKPVFA